TYRQGGEGIGRRVVTDDPRRVSYDGGLRAAHAVNLRRAAHGEDATSHIVNLEVRNRGGLGRPRVGSRVVFEGVSRVRTHQVRGASSDGVEAPVGREVV